MITIKANSSAVESSRQDYKESFLQIERLFNAAEQRFQNFDQRFNSIDGWFDRIDRRFDRIGRRFDGMDARVNGIDKRFDNIDDMSTIIPLLIDRHDRLEERLHVQENDISDLLMIPTKRRRLVDVAEHTFI